MHLPVRNIGLFKWMLITIYGMIKLPIIFAKNYLVSDKPNPINNKLQVSSVRKNSVSRDFKVTDIKHAASKYGVTINDYVTAAIGVTIKKYFYSKNFNHTREITIAFPINIRYSQP